MFSKFSLYFYLILCLFPITAGFIYAFLYSLGLIGAMNTGFTLNHWKDVLGSKELLSSFALTILISVMVVLASWWMAVTILRYYAKELTKTILKNGLLIPLTLPMLIGAFIVMQIFRSGGLFASLLYKIGLISSAQSLEWVNDYWHIGLGICLILFTLPYFIILVLQKYNKHKIPELLEINTSMGGTKSIGWYRIAMPILWIETKLSMLLYGIFLFGTYEAALLLGRQNPRLVSVLIAQKLRKFDLQTIPQAYVLSIIYTLLIVVFIYLFSRKSYHEVS